MSYRNLSEDEKLFSLIIEDLRFLFSLDEILSQDILNVLSKLKSDEVKAYIRSLSQDAKPETALREAFFAGRSILSKYLGGEVTPEVNLGPGFVDYVLKIDGRFVLIELKSLFEADYEEGKVRRLRRLRQRELNWQQHKDQVLKYIQRGSDFIILTNLKDWFFFNKECSPADFKFFFTANIFDFIEEYDVVGNFWDYLRRKDFQSIREGLDKRFFESLKIWVTKLSEIEFDVDEKTKVELIIRLLNKFIFIQTLDDFFVIDARWVKTNWDDVERKWQAKGKYQVLKEFFSEIDKWFYEYYDTELFRTNILEHVKKDEANIDKLHSNLLLVLGLTYWQTMFSGFKGIMQYNFHYIDEDIFGKAYETFLAEVRHDEGIYYTPKYITEYIVENTVGKEYDNLLPSIEKAIKEEDFDTAKELITRFISVRILDPACGSGSFLIKAIRKIMDKYRRLNGLLKELDVKYNKYHGSLVRPKEIEQKAQHISELADMVKAENERELISHLLVRHIHGNDLDNKALEVAKVNIWLEAIKLAPTEFRFDRLPKETNHILPDLEMNLVNGNTVVGLPENLVIDFLQTNHKDEIHKLSELRKQYLENPTMPELVEQMEETKKKLKSGLDAEFKKYLFEKELSANILEETKPLYWPLEMWYFYFIDDEPLNEHSRGADIVIGNPPYERIQVLKKKSPGLVEFLNNAGFESTTNNYDLAIIFIEKGYKLLKQNGDFGYIVTNKFMTADYGEGIRRFVSRNKALNQLINFGDQQVFENATTYTALIFLKRETNKQFKYGHVTNLQRNLEQLTKIMSHDALNEIDQISSILDSGTLSDEPWVFAKTGEEEILEKFKELPRLGYLSQIFVGLQTSADPVYIVELKEDMGSLVKVYSRSLKKERILERDLLKPLLMGKDIKRWFINEYKYLLLFPYIIKNNKAILIQKEELVKKHPRTWDYLVESKNELGQRERGSWSSRPDWYGYVYLKNMDKFDKPKILTQVLANKASFSLDKDGKYYFPGGGNAGGYGIFPKDKKMSLQYLCALLDSALLDWHLKKISTRFRGGFYSYAKRFIEKLPIVPIDRDESKEIARTLEEIIDKIISLNKARFTLLQLWSEISTRLKNDERPLTKILLQDEEAVKKGEFNNTWTSKVSFYPSAKNEIFDKEFNDFTIFADSDKLLLKVYGLTDEGKEEEIFDFEFRNKELMLHVHYCLVSAISSRLKIGTLKQLLDKTLVPVIQPNVVENTVNIIKKLEDEFSREMKEPSEVDLVKVDNSIIDCEAQIDALVFKLYGLNIQEMTTVMQSLELLPSYQQLVLKHFK